MAAVSPLALYTFSHSDAAANGYGAQCSHPIGLPHHSSRTSSRNRITNDASVAMGTDQAQPPNDALSRCVTDRYMTAKNTGARAQAVAMMTTARRCWPVESRIACFGVGMLSIFILSGPQLWEVGPTA